MIPSDWAELTVYILIVAALALLVAPGARPPRPDPPCSNIVICYGDPYLGRA